MRELPAIQAVYVEIDAIFEAHRKEALAASDQAATSRTEAKQRVNDQAYFILIWGQMETAIDEACRRSIRARRDSENRTDRRVWELFNPDDKRLSGLSFEERVSLVLDKNRGPSCAWKKIMNYYNIRNQIAHGTLLANRIDITEVVRDFFVIQGELET